MTGVLKIEEKNYLSFDSAKEYYDGVKIKLFILSLPFVIGCEENFEILLPETPITACHSIHRER